MIDLEKPDGKASYIQGLYKSSATRSTSEILMDWLEGAPPDDNSPEEINIRLLFGIFSIIHRDALDLSRQIRRELEKLRRESLDRSKLLTHLEHWQTLLTSHRTQVSISLRCLNKSIFIMHILSQSGSPQSPIFSHIVEGPELETPIIPALTAIHKQFKELIANIERLEIEVSDCSNFMVSAISILNSDRQIHEAISVTKLTELAFFFIPLAFSCSLFAMQVKVRQLHFCIT
jgi:Mg2+ and Co2+ transporter CorA